MKRVKILEKLEKTIALLEIKKKEMIAKEAISIDRLNALSLEISSEQEKLNVFKTEYANLVSMQKKDINSHHLGIITECSNNKEEAKRLILREEKLEEDYQYKLWRLNTLISDNKIKEKNIQKEKNELIYQRSLLKRWQEKLSINLKECDSLKKVLEKKEIFIKNLEEESFRIYEYNKSQSKFYKEKFNKLSKREKTFKKEQKEVLKDITNRELKIKDQWKQLLSAKKYLEKWQMKK